MGGEKLLTIPDLCERLALKPAFMRKLIFQKRIPTVRLGRCVRFKPSEIEAWIAERSTPARADR